MLLDTSALIEISRHKANSRLVQRVNQVMSEEEELFVSIVQLAEIADWSLRNDLSVSEELSAVKEFAQVIPLDEAICNEAAVIKKKRRSQGSTDFGLIDAIILSSARSIAQKILTFDPHFSGENDCVVLER
jgi:predicted nucleic acid-binding protein